MNVQVIFLFNFARILKQSKRQRNYSKADKLCGEIKYAN